MKKWEQFVASDFGFENSEEGAANTATLLVDHFEAGSSSKWAEDLGFYTKSFRRKSIGRALMAFGKQPENRLFIAAKIRRASEDADMSDVKRDEAKFAYALILAHYDGHHKSQNITENDRKSIKKMFRKVNDSLSNHFEMMIFFFLHERCLIWEIHGSKR